VKVLTLIQQGDTLNLIEERHLDSLGSAYEQAIRNLELQITEYSKQTDLHKANAARYKQISRNDSEIIKTYAHRVEKLTKDKTRIKFKAAILAGLGFTLGVLIAK